MASATDLAKMVPGFDFLQGLMKNAGAGLPNIGQWIAPTLDPDRLEEEIQKLRTVQFWLEQNAKLLATTVQALEVQRMTLSTLRTMNLPLADLREALKVPASAPAPAAAAREPARPAPAAEPPAARKPVASRKKAAAAAPAPVIDPMQWWSALTQQFAELATQAVKDTGGEAARNLAGAMVKPSIDVAGAALRQAAAAPAKVARAAGGMAAGAAKAARSARSMR